MKKGWVLGTCILQHVAQTPQLCSENQIKQYREEKAQLLVAWLLAFFTHRALPAGPFQEVWNWLVLPPDPKFNNQEWKIAIKHLMGQLNQSPTVVSREQ